MAAYRRIEEPIELVYFIFPVCDGNCAHCWSSEMRMGRYKNILWHESMLEALGKMPYQYKEIKLSGGEPFLHPEIGEIPYLLHKKLGDEIPITIFTSGRPFVSYEKGSRGIEETKTKLLKLFKCFDNLSIHMSIDEFHVAELAKLNQWKPEEVKDNLKNYIMNFIFACEDIKQLYNGFLGPKLKIHCETGRKKYHQKQLFNWFPIEWWENYAILTEGLVYSGNAKKLQHTFKLRPNKKMSYFLLPGVDFYEKPLSERSEMFYDIKHKKALFLDDSENCAIMISGWWNLIDKKPMYQCIYIK